MTQRAAIAALVLPALVLAALAARSYQPFAGEAGGRRATPPAFFDGVFTVRPSWGSSPRGRFWAWFRRCKGARRPRCSALSAFLVVVLVVIALTAVIAAQDILRNEGSPGRTGERRFRASWTGGPGAAEATRGRARSRVRLVACDRAGCPHRRCGRRRVIAERRRDRRGRRTLEQLEDLGKALDEAIDDLRRDPDPRRAVIAAYARMERALTLYGVPRRPSEAPFEYLRRVGRELEAEEPLAALTELFEVAKFSEHSVDESMRGRAIDALTAVRREVRAAT